MHLPGSFPHVAPASCERPREQPAFLTGLHNPECGQLAHHAGSSQMSALHSQVLECAYQLHNRTQNRTYPAEYHREEL